MNKKDSKKSALDQWLSKSKKAKVETGLKKKPSDEPALLSFGQERLWMLDQLYPNQNLYNYIQHYSLSGNINAELLAESFVFLGQENEILRSNYKIENGNTIQFVNHDKIQIKSIDLSELTPKEQVEELSRSKKDFSSHSFNLEEDPLFQVFLFQLGINKIEVFLVLHHIIGDAWSLGIINEKVSEYYKSLVSNTVIQAGKERNQYIDFAYWQKQQSLQKKDIDYWKNKLSGELPTLEFPKTNQKTTNLFEGSTHTHKLSAELSTQIKTFAKEQNTTPYVVLLAAYKLFLSKYCQQKDVIVASPFSNRDTKELEEIIGFFNETVVLRTKIEQQKSFIDLINQLKQDMLEAMEHKNVPFDALVNELNIDRRAGENPLFQTMFLYNSAQKQMNLGEEISIKEEQLDLRVSKFDLTLFINEADNDLSLLFEHSSLINSELIASISHYFEVLLKQVIDQPITLVQEVSILPQNEYNQQIKDWNNTSTPLPKVESIQELIAQSSLENDIAVTWNEKRLSYKELDEWSSQIASFLQQRGIVKGDFVGLYTQRSLEMIVGIMGIIKAGGAYLPLDPEYPKERIGFMLEDTATKVVLTQPNKPLEMESDFFFQFPISPFNKGETVHYESTTNLLDQFAYIIYTSGSTGQPKGVPVTHQNLIHSNVARLKFYEDPVSSFLLLSSFSFDSSVAGIFGTLCSGGKLVLPPQRIEQDVEQLANLIKEEKVSHSLMLPSLYQVLVTYASEQHLDSLVAIMVAGEACSTSLIEQHFSKLPKVKLYNEYGPTEASVWCIAHEFKQGENIDAVPIGKPIPNAQAYILDENLKPLPTGLSGELYIGGIGITKGYLNRPELTKEKFLPSPFNKGKTIYKTGDLAKYRPDGTIDFLGRADSQVKIRGHRVELEEIRSHILNHTQIKETIVTISNHTNIIAYLESDNIDLVGELKAQLKKTLPSYMVPSDFILMKELPKLPNGKVNVKHLISLKREEKELEPIALPTNKTEQQLIDIWKSILSLEHISINDNFFDIGGDSIRSIQIVAKARQNGLKIGPTQLFDHQTIKELALNISTVNQEIVLSKEEYPLSLPLGYQQQAFLFHSLQSKNDQGLLQLEFNLSGAINVSLFEEAWRELILIHPVLRTSFHWHSIEDTYQTIHETAPLNWIYKDLSNEEDKDQQSFITGYKETDLSQSIDLSKEGASRLALFQRSNTDFYLCWTCHHILLDGWSAAIVIQDALTIYESLEKEKQHNLSPVPSYASYTKWKSNQKEELAQRFWSKLFKDSTIQHFSSTFHSRVKNKFEDQTVYLEPKIVSTLEDIVKEQRQTLHTVMQGLWMICLANFFNSKDISIGLTVSGRSSDFDGIDRMSGLLMNVLPIRKSLNKQQSIEEWLKGLQQLLNEVKAFEYTDANKIQSWSGKKSELFDSLFVFGNFMKERVQVGSIAIEGFKGDFSSTYPLTVRVNPASVFEINFRYKTNFIHEEEINWLIENYQQIIHSFISNDRNTPIDQLMQGRKFVEDEEQRQLQKNEVEEYHGIQNSIQLKLSRIWEEILSIRGIDIEASFFDLGGTSLGALRLFSEIEEQFNQKLAPTALISNPSIAQLSELIATEGNESNWSSIVAMKTSGEKAPLFCIHSGGAHVLFYQGLAKYMKDDRPVYAIQPTGIDGEESYHDSITEMASHYIQEMKKVQPNGPYHLIGTCFGNAVGLEMMHQLQANNEEVAVFYVVDSAPAYLIPPSPNGEKKPVSRMVAMVAKGNWRGILKKFRNRYIRINKKRSASFRTEQETELDEMIDSLNDVYSKYTWKPIDGNFILIRSKEFSERKDKQFHLDRWQYLSKNKVSIQEVDGHHLSLFEEPEVQGLTKFISRHLASIQ